jgi:hypothetical protein
VTRRPGRSRRPRHRRRGRRGLRPTNPRCTCCNLYRSPGGLCGRCGGDRCVECCPGVHDRHRTSRRRPGRGALRLTGACQRAGSISRSDTAVSARRACVSTRTATARSLTCGKIVLCRVGRLCRTLDRREGFPANDVSVRAAVARPDTPPAGGRSAPRWPRAGARGDDGRGLVDRPLRPRSAAVAVPVAGGGQLPPLRGERGEAARPRHPAALRPGGATAAAAVAVVDMLGGEAVGAAIEGQERDDGAVGGVLIHGMPPGGSGG